MLYRCPPLICSHDDFYLTAYKGKVEISRMYKWWCRYWFHIARFHHCLKSLLCPTAKFIKKKVYFRCFSFAFYKKVGHFSQSQEVLTPVWGTFFGTFIAECKCIVKNWLITPHRFFNVELNPFYWQTILSLCCSNHFSIKQRNKSFSSRCFSQNICFEVKWWWKSMFQGLWSSKLPFIYNIKFYII